jgi:hypothetical protein
MGIDTFELLLSAIAFFVYGSICMISLFFTFSPDAYMKLHDTLNFYVFSTPILSPIERSIDWFDVWAMRNNVIVGPILITLSLVDLKLIFDIIRSI